MISSITITFIIVLGISDTMIQRDRGQERLGPSYFFTSLVLGSLNSLFFFPTRP